MDDAKKARLAHYAAAILFGLIVAWSVGIIEHRYGSSGFAFDRHWGELATIGVITICYWAIEFLLVVIRHRVNNAQAQVD